MLTGQLFPGSFDEWWFVTPFTDGDWSCAMSNCLHFTQVRSRKKSFCTAFHRVWSPLNEFHTAPQCWPGSAHLLSTRRHANYHAADWKQKVNSKNAMLQFKSEDSRTWFTKSTRKRCWKIQAESTKTCLFWALQLSVVVFALGELGLRWAAVKDKCGELW